MAKKENRFEITYSQGVMEQIRIIVDKETGVNYLQSYTGQGIGLTPLLDRNGLPVITTMTSNKY